jgi:GT2 family glycosyltransferase
MATAVIDLEFNRLPAEMEDLDNYQAALILVRLHDRPMMRIYLPVNRGRIDGEVLRDAVINAIDWNFCKQLLMYYLSIDVPRERGANLKTATIAVCTRDRPVELQRCLLALKDLPDDGQEYLVIDSCSSSDETKEIVKSVPGFRYVREDYPGLNRARNRALREARHEVVVFIDDDAVPDPGWLRAHLKNFNDPLVLCTTGLTMPLELETDAQEWFERYSPFSRGFERKVFTRLNLNPLAVGQVGAGVNMAFRRDAFEKVGAFDEALDAGTLTHSGGETEMFSRILCAGFRIVYDPAALNWHSHRRTWKELRQALYGYGVGVYAVWTRKLLYEGEGTIPLVALSWFLHDQLPALIRSLLHLKNSLPVELVLAELLGCLRGPFAYVQSRGRNSNKVIAGS